MTSNNNKALIVMGHGSRREAANIEFFGYVEKIAKADQARDDQQYQWVDAAFLELAQPTLLQACETAIHSGCQQIDVYPLFLNQGKHVEKDIPQQVAEVMGKHPNIEVRLLDYMGSTEALIDLVVNHLRAQS